MSFLNDKLKTKKAGHSDGFRNLIDSTGNERNISLSKSSRHFLRELEIRGAMGQVPEHGIDEIIVSPDNKVEPYGTTTPVNANEVEGRVPDGFIELENLYCTGKQYCKIPNITKTIDFHMIIKAASFQEVGYRALFSIQNQNNDDIAFEIRIPDEKVESNVSGAAFSMPMMSLGGAESQGFFEVGITDTCNGFSATGIMPRSITTEEREDGAWTVTARVGDTKVYTGTYYTNNRDIYLFRRYAATVGLGELPFVGQFSYALIYNGDEKVSELVAAKRKSDGAIGILEIYGERRGNFYVSLGTESFYSSYPDRLGFSEKEKTLYKLTLKSAKRGLPKGYIEMTQLVTPEAPGDYDRFVDFGNTQLLPSSIHGLIADIDVTLLYASGYGTVLTRGIIAFGAYSTVRIIEEDTNSIEKEYDYWNVNEATNIRSNRVIIACQIDNNASNPAHECLMNLTGYYFDTGAKFSASRTSDVKYNYVAATKFAIGAMRNAYSRSGFAFRKVTFTEQATGKVAIEIIPCKREDGEYGLYLINHIQNKEKFFPFTLDNVSGIQNFDVFPENGTTWRGKKYNQEYLSGESTLLRDIKETTIYLPEPLIKISGFANSLDIKNSTGTKKASESLSALALTVSGGRNMAGIPDNMKAYGIEYPGVIADNPDWNETSIENLTAFSASPSGHYFGANLTQNPDTSRWELAGYGDSVAIVVPKSINTTDGRIAGLADSALSHARFDQASYNYDRSWAQLKRLYIPNGYTVLPTGLCYYNNYLEKVIIPSELKEIGIAAFHYNHRIKKLLPTNFYGKVPENIDIVIPNSVTKIGAAAFDAVGLYGSNRMRVCIGESVNYLGYASLSGKFSDIYLPNNIVTMVFNGTLGVFGLPNADLSNLNFYCNKDTITYQRLKAHLTSVYNLTEEQADARIITEDKGGGYINFNYSDTFNVYYAAFNYFYILGGMVLPIVSDKFQEVPGSQNPNSAHNNRSYLSLNFTGPFQVTCQSWYHDWTPQSPSISGRAARIWFTLPKEYDTVEKARMYFAQNPTTFCVIGRGEAKIPIDMSKVEIGDGERELFIENEFGALSDDGASGYGTMLSNFVLGDRKNPSYTKVQYYSNKSK